MITSNGYRLSEACIWMRAMMAGAIAVTVSVAVTVRTEAQTSLPEITVSPPPLPPKSIIEQPDRKGSGDGKGGSDAKGGVHRSLDRLNEQLKRKVDETNPLGNDPPLDGARRPSAARIYRAN
jgi:hypothetical protein